MLKVPLLGGLLGLAAPAAIAQEAFPLDRTVLPLREPQFPLSNQIDVRKATAPPRFEVKAPDGAPNVLLVLIDDLGFAGTSKFGGPVPTPTFDRVAREGVRYVNFHTTAVCSPTRTALKSGRNHHVNNMGGIIETGNAFPGNTGQIPNNVAPLAEMLRLNGFSTAAFGKWHETAAWEASMAGPFDRWPTRQGFDKFYGFLGGETDHWAPSIYDGVSQVVIPEDESYHFLTDMTNQTVAWIKFQKALTPDRPFFAYYAPGAVHAPHHVPQEWVDKYKGKFDQGWDKMREEVLERQIAGGIVPQGTKLAPKPKDIPDWDTLSADEKRLFARQAEVFAAFLAMTDYEVGRVIEAIRETGQLDNTLVILIYGDNGTSAEGGRNGMFSEMTYFNGVQETVADMLKFIDKWGGPETYPHMAAGWAVAFDTPYQWTKQVASDHGGTKVGMAIRWPGGMTAKDEQRSQFHHVIDVAPTILEACSVPEPKVVNGTPQRSMDGVSMMYSFDHADALDRRTTQYFEMFGNRAIYHNGWFARTIHRAPWESENRRALDDDSAWELFDVANDFSLVNDLSAKYPEKLAQMQALFLAEAKRNNVLPMDDRLFERLNAELVNRPDLMAGRTSLTLAEGMTGMTENVFINIKNKSKTITAEVVVPEGKTHGTILVQGGRFGGWSLYVNDGVPGYDYNFLGIQRFSIIGNEVLKPGKNTIRFEFAYDGGGLGKGGTGTLFVNDQKVGEGRIEHTQPMVFSADETADVGIDLATPVVEVIGSKSASKFTGRIERVKIEVSE